MKFFVLVLVLGVVPTLLITTYIMRFDLKLSKALATLLITYCGLTLVSFIVSVWFLFKEMFILGGLI